MGRKKGQQRFGYRDLTPAYKKRLERSGISKNDWEMGADLRGARGHKPTPPKTAAPIELTQRVVRGEGTEADFRGLAEFTRPGWIPKEASVDVAAALSQLPNPRSWDRVEFTPRADGEPWTMTVTPKRGYPITIEIPGGGGTGSGAREVLDIVAVIEDQKERKGEPMATRAMTAAEAVFYDVLGSV